MLFKGTQGGSLKDPPKYQNVFYKLFLKLLNVTRNKTCYKNKWVRPIIKTVNCPGSNIMTHYSRTLTSEAHYDVRSPAFWFRIAVADPGVGWGVTCPDTENLCKVCVTGTDHPPPLGMRMTSHGQCPRGVLVNVQEWGCFSIFRRADDVTRTMSKGGCL